MLSGVKRATVKRQAEGVLMKNVVRLGAGSGFWGDAADPAMELLRGGALDYLCFDYLAELTMALLERQRRKDPEAGYVPEAVDTLVAMLGLARDCGTRLITNGGGVNPRAAAESVAAAARQAGLHGLRVAAVEGDGMVDRLDELTAAGCALRNFDTGEDGFGAIRDRVVSANVYTDSSGITEALGADAAVVIAGRVSDNAPYVGALAHEFGWRHDAAHADRIGAAITLGHLVECASGCTGGMSSRWAEMPRMGEVGFPILEVAPDGSAVLTKLPGTGGRIDLFTVKEHLLYEIGDPADYRMPDGVTDFTTLALADDGEDRVRLSGMTGRGRPDELKMVIGYNDGWIGVDMLHGPAAPAPEHEPNEAGLRVAVRTRSREEAEKVRRACANLWIMGPGGTSFGAPMKPRPVVAAWPTLIPREFVRQSVHMMVA
jgi:hypothetical protein